MKPCPFCGAAPEKGIIGIICPNCGAVGPQAETEAEQEKKWDTRVGDSQKQPSQKPKTQSHINFNIETKKWEGITKEDIERWAETFPACDVPYLLKVMASWVTYNCPRSKKSNWRRFIFNWLNRAQDRGGTNNHLKKPQPKNLTDIKSKFIGQKC